MQYIKKLCCYMPCYNAERTVGKTIYSILNQTYKDFDLIICNDGSTDSSLHIIEKIAEKDNRIKVYSNSSNMGLGYTSNRMFELCSNYEYVALMDADDIAPQNRFEMQVNYLDKHEDISCVAGIMQCIDEDDNLGFIYDCCLRNDDEIKKALIFYDPIPNGSSMIRMSHLLKYNIRYDERFFYAQDYKFYCDLSKEGKIVILPYILLYYRVHDNNISASTLKKKKERDELLDEIHRINFNRYNIKGGIITKKVLMRGYRDTLEKSIFFRFIFALTKRIYVIFNREYIGIIK